MDILNTNTNCFAIFRRIFDTAVVKHVNVTDEINSLHWILTANLRWNDFIWRQIWRQMDWRIGLLCLFPSMSSSFTDLSFWTLLFSKITKHWNPELRFHVSSIVLIDVPFTWPALVVLDFQRFAHESVELVSFHFDGFYCFESASTVPLMQCCSRFFPLTFRDIQFVLSASCCDLYFRFPDVRRS